jgi:hypothetical protein
MEEPLIVCTKCNTPKAGDEFPSNGAGGKRQQCKLCMREINKAWRARNKEKIATYNKERRTK